MIKGIRQKPSHKGIKKEIDRPALERSSLDCERLKGLFPCQFSVANMQIFII